MNRHEAIRQLTLLAKGNPDAEKALERLLQELAAACTEKPAAVPGWKLVPPELTSEMEAAGWPAETAADGYRATLTAAPSAAPDGYLVVPVTPSDDMLVAGQEAWWCARRERNAVEDCREAADVWSAMVRAAQSELHIVTAPAETNGAAPVGLIATLLDALVLALPYVTDAEGFPERFKPGVVARHVKQVRAAIKAAEGVIR